MTQKEKVLQAIKDQLIVSCQANEGEPLYEYDRIAQGLAKAALEGGAQVLRANDPENVRLIKEITDVPVIGIHKQDYDDSPVFITPTYKEVKAVIESGAEIVALDGTNQKRPGGVTLKEIVEEAKKEFPDILLMADISTYEEGMNCSDLGFDIISSTLSGYTSYSRQDKGPDYRLVARLVERSEAAIIAEGKIATPDEVKIMFELGAFAVVVGGAITRPQNITRMFINALK